MNTDRYNRLKAMIQEERWEIDVTMGDVRGRRGSQGHIDTFGYKRMTAKQGGKEYHFGTHEIVAIKQGIDLTGKEVTFKDGDKQNTAFDNLLIGSPGSAARAAMTREGAHQTARLTKETTSRIKRDLLDGLSRAEIAQKYNTKERSVARIDRGLAFETVEPMVMQ